MEKENKFFKRFADCFGLSYGDLKNINEYALKAGFMEWNIHNELIECLDDEFAKMPEALNDTWKQGRGLNYVLANGLIRQIIENAQDFLRDYKIDVQLDIDFDVRETYPSVWCKYSYNGKGKLYETLGIDKAIAENKGYDDLETLLLALSKQTETLKRIFEERN